MFPPRISLLMLAVGVSLVFLYASPPAVSALDPPDCYQDNSCTEQQKCEFENLQRNWPQKTGYYRDCSQLSTIPKDASSVERTVATAKERPDIAVAIVAVPAVLSWLIIRKVRARKKAAADKDSAKLSS